MTLPKELFKIIKCNIERILDLKYLGSGAFGHVFQGKGYQKLYSIKLTKPQDSIEESDEFHIHKDLYHILENSSISNHLSINEPITEYLCSRRENMDGFEFIMSKVPEKKQYTTNILSGIYPLAPIRIQITSFFPGFPWSDYIESWPGNPEHVTILFSTICSLFEMFLMTEGRFKHKDIHSGNILVKDEKTMIKRTFKFPDADVFFYTSYEIKIIDFGISKLSKMTTKKINIKKNLTGDLPDFNYHLFNTLYQLRLAFPVEMKILEEFLNVNIKKIRHKKMSEYDFYSQLISLDIFDNIRSITEYE